MGDHDLLRVHALVDRALIAIEAVADVLEHLVVMPIEGNMLFLSGGAATDFQVAIGIVGQRGVVLAAEGHGCTSSAVKVAENSVSCSSGRNRLASFWPVAP